MKKIRKTRRISPVAKAIRIDFENRKKYYSESYEDLPICRRVPFERWMNYYLFPETIGITPPSNKTCFDIVYTWACDHFDEETILRVMVEAGIID